MPTNTASQHTSLHFSHTFQAPPEKVFDAWTNPKALTQWFGPTDEFTVPLAEVDLRVGGAYRIQMKSPDGELHTVIGTYKEIIPSEKLVFTWAWEAGSSCGDAEAGESLVTVRIQAQGSSTEMTLIHERFPDSETRDKHQQGWNGCLGRLGKIL